MDKAKDVSAPSTGIFPFGLWTVLGWLSLLFSSILQIAMIPKYKTLYQDTNASLPEITRFYVGSPIPMLAPIAFGAILHWLAKEQNRRSFFYFLLLFGVALALYGFAYYILELPLRPMQDALKIEP